MNPFFNPLTRQMDVGPDAGENVSVTGNTVNFIGGGTEGAVYNAGPGLTLSGNVFSANVAAVGFGMELAGGTASYARYRAIETVSGSSVTLMAGHAYKVYATAAAVTLNTETIPSGQYGQEGHLEIFVAGTGYVMTGTNVVLANALEPDSVNNCTVRFHDGIAIITVEDHVAGYIVVNGSTSGDGSLAYGIATSTNDYVAFDASLNGTTIPLAGATAEGEKHVVGNGYTETAITGAVNCGTSRFTVANLGLQNVQVTGGTMTLGDAFIPSGSTVAVSGGGLAVEKVTGNGGMILTDGNVVVDGGNNNLVSDIVIAGTGNPVSGTVGGFFCKNDASTIFSNVVFSGIVASSDGLAAGATFGAATKTYLTGCTFTNNSNAFANSYNPITGMYTFNAFRLTGQLAEVQGTFDTDQNIGVEYGGEVRFKGENKLLAKVMNQTNRFGTVTLTSGAILDLTGNTNATPIAPGGGITFESGGATVKVGDSTASSSYMMDNVTLPAGAKLTNTVVVNLGGSNMIIATGKSTQASGVVFTGGSAAVGGVMNTAGNNTFTSCVFSANSGGSGGIFYVNSNGNVTLSGCSAVNNTASVGSFAYIFGGAMNLTDCNIAANQQITLRGGAITVAGSNTIGIISNVVTAGTVTISSGASINLTSSINPGGTGGITVLTGGCTVNGNAIPAGTYTSIDSNGQPT